MKRLLITLAALCFAHPASAADSLFDCTVEAPQVTNLTDGKFVTNAIVLKDVTEEVWAFTMSTNSHRVKIDWPSSPVGLSGSAEIVLSDEGTNAAFFLRETSCVFNSTTCGGTLMYSAQPDGSLIIQFSPLAAQRFPDGHMEPFVAFLKGRCTPTKDVK